MPLFSCADIDDGLQNQAQVAKSLDISLALYFKVKKTLTIMMLSSITLHRISQAK
jgi:hypothetical protein